MFKHIHNEVHVVKNEVYCFVPIYANTTNNIAFSTKQHFKDNPIGFELYRAKRFEFKYI